MSKILRHVALATAFLGFIGFTANSANASTIHKKHHHITDIYSHHHTSHHTKHHVKNHASTMVRTAQTHLTHLGYYKGKADGLLGPKTATAVKNFQHDHHLHANGKLTTITYNAIIKTDLERTKAVASVAKPMPEPAPIPPPPPAPDFYKTHPDFYGYYDQPYADPYITAPTVTANGNEPVVRSQAIPNRYAKIDAAEDVRGSEKRYVVTLNGAPFLTVEDQPSVIGISRTFVLGDEDAIIFSTYRANSAACSFKHYLLTLRADGNNLQEIGNCTRGYQAKMDQGSLYVIFPETDDGRPVGATWRYEPGDLERL